VPIQVTGSVAGLPATAEAAALLVDLPSLSTTLFSEYGLLREPQEWWLATRPGGHAAATAAAAALPGLDVLDRRAAAARAGRDPYGTGARAALLAAAVGAVLIAALAIAVGVRANAGRRGSEYAVLRALGASPRLLARSLVAEQVFLAGTGVLTGLAVGLGVAAALAPLVVLSPAAARPVPEPLLAVAWLPVAASAAALFLLAVGLSALVAATVRRRLVAADIRLEVEP
jgi:predicted lysophospholipase L1 biosynthesis ABC-type transport system permease subunit